MRIKSLALALVVIAGSLLVAAPANASVPVFKNCTAMHKVYKHGVGRKGAKDHVASKKDKPVTNFHVSTTIYNANKKSDRDHDGIACEAH
jgi:Excalibur calcium-binding domain